MTISSLRIRRARWIAAAIAVIAATAIFWLARSYTFYFDEWTFIQTAPDWSLATYLTPHNEHPSMLMRLVYSILLNTVGLRSYLPYMFVLIVLHASNVVLLFELVQRRAGDAIGLGAAALLAVLGAGWDDVLWAFQMAWLASVALGLAMMLVLQRPSTPRTMFVAAALLTASLMFSGIGAVFAVSGTIQLAVTAGRRRDLTWFLPTGVALAVWYVAFGRFGTHPNPPPSATNLFLLPQYALWGLSQSVAGLIGEGGWIGLPLLGAAVVALAIGWKRRHPDPTAIGLAAGLVAFYAMTGLTRAQLGYGQAGASRYVYIGAVLWLALLADPLRQLPWRGTWRPALAACLFLACFNSAVLLFSFATARVVVMDRQISDLQALASVRGDPCLDPKGAADLLVMPVETDPARYYRAIDRYGDPSAGRPITDRADFDRARANLLSGGCR